MFSLLAPFGNDREAGRFFYTLTDDLYFGRIDITAAITTLKDFIAQQNLAQKSDISEEKEIGIRLDSEQILIIKNWRNLTEENKKRLVNGLPHTAPITIELSTKEYPDETTLLRTGIEVVRWLEKNGFCRVSKKIIAETVSLEEKTDHFLPTPTHCSGKNALGMADLPFDIVSEEKYDAVSNSETNPILDNALGIIEAQINRLSKQKPTKHTVDKINQFTEMYNILAGGDSTYKDVTSRINVVKYLLKDHYFTIPLLRRRDSWITNQSIWARLLPATPSKRAVDSLIDELNKNKPTKTRQGSYPN